MKDVEHHDHKVSPAPRGGGRRHVVDRSRASRRQALRRSQDVRGGGSELVVAPGGFRTRDARREASTVIQTGKIGFPVALLDTDREQMPGRTRADTVDHGLVSGKGPDHLLVVTRSPVEAAAFVDEGYEPRVREGSA